MALSDTARLIASLELQDKFSKPASNAERALGRLQARANQFGKGIGQVGAGLGVAAVKFAAIGVALTGAGIGLLATNIRAGIDSLRELENVTVATNTVIASTKGVAGQTAASVRNLAEEFEDLNATMDDKVIQSAANMLLTFTNVRGKAFEPALQAALDMNEAMGGGEEGLQNTILQLGKALQDPVAGFTALKRVGVTLSEEQKKQIKVLVEQNDLYGAQQVILRELGTEFGGRFAAAGRTAEARSASLRDKIEDLQQALSKPIVPVLDKITTKLISLFEKPAAAAAASNLGEAIADLFSEQNLADATNALEGFISQLTPANFAKVGDGVRSVFGFLEAVPWGTIADGLRITGQAAKVAVDAFLSLPKEVQGIVIAALAVNKLSGGLVASGIGNIAGGLFGGGGLLGRGSSPANPMWVAQVGGVPGGGTGGGVVAAGGGIIRSLLGVTTAVGLGAILGNAIGKNLFFNPTIQPAVDFEREQFTRVAGSQDLGQINNGMTAINSGLDDLKNADKQQVELAGQQVRLGFLANLLTGEQTAILEGQKQTLEQARAEIVAATGNASSASSSWSQKQLAAFAGLTNEQRATASAARTTAQATNNVAARVNDARATIGRGFSELGGVVRSKDFAPHVTVRVTSNVAITDITRRLVSARVSTGTISEF